MRHLGWVWSTLFVVVSACGGSPELADGPRPADARPDAVTIFDARPPGPVTLTAFTRRHDPGGTLQAGVQVVVIQPDGSTGDVGITDANGEATLDDVQAGAGIAAIYNGDPVSSVVLFVAVQPGDHLTVGKRYYRTTVAGTAGTMTVNFPSVNLASIFAVHHPCTSNNAYGAAFMATLDLWASCQTPTAPIAIVVYDKNSNMIRSAVLRDAPYTPGSVVTLPGWQTPRSLTIDVSGLPIAVDNVNLVAVSVVDRLPEFGGYGEFWIPPDAGAASATVVAVPDVDRLVAAYASWRNHFGPHDSARVVAPDATSTSFVESGLPWLGPVIASGIDQAAGWAQEPGTVPGDGAIGFAEWSRYDPVAETYQGYEWTIVMPPGATGWQWPAGPAELAPYLPTSGDEITADAAVVDFETVADYDALRALPEWVLSCPGCAIRAGDGPAATTAHGFQGDVDFAPRAPWRRR